MHRFIPLPIEFLECCRVPPILIKLSMIKFRDLCKEVSKTFKSQNKHYHDK